MQKTKQKKLEKIKIAAISKEKKKTKNASYWAPTA